MSEQKEEGCVNLGAPRAHSVYTEQPPIVNPLQQKYEEYRGVVSQNPDDFQTWTYLLGTAERIDEFDKIVEVFDMFLQEYPLCYGYWKKYADSALKHRGIEAAIGIYERGLEAVQNSVDLWCHYLTFRMTKATDDPPITRSLFERGISAIGQDYLCHTLWDKYLQFENEGHDFHRMALIYERILSVPCKELEQYHGKFVKFALEHSINEVLMPEQISDFKSQIIDEKKNSVDGDANVEDNNVKNANGDLMDVEISPQSISDQEVKKYWMNKLADVYDETAKSLSAKREFEECIKRPYFHVKPLDNVQLQAWWKYLDYVCRECSHKEVVILFERCLVACALYPEFWMRYVMYMDGIDAAQAFPILQRAIGIFCKKKSEMHLFAARFYEGRGDLESARQSLSYVTSQLTPDLLSGIIAHASFEYRNGDLDKGNSIYESKLESEMEKEKSDIVGYLAVQYAHINLKKFGNKERARELVDKAISKRPDLVGVWEGAIQLEDLIGDEHSINRSIQFYQSCLSSAKEDGSFDMDESNRCTMSKRLLHFLDLHGSAEEHAQAFKYHLEKFGLRQVAPSLHEKRSESSQLEDSSKKQAQGGKAESQSGDGKTPNLNSMTEYFAQNPALQQQYAQYYQQYAAAAAAYGGSYAAYGANASHTG